MSNQIPGVPEGWELVRVGVVHHGEWRLMDDRSIRQWLTIEPSVGWAVVLRKIEKPARYRPFANAEEAHPFWDTPLRLAGATEEMKNSWSRITTIEKDGITTSAKFYTWEQAYYRFYIDDNHTPFGVKIDE